MNYKVTAFAILVTGSLSAQSQPQTSPKPVQQNAASKPPAVSTNGGPTSAKMPISALAFDVPESTQLILPGCPARPTSPQSPNRDYSQPSSRLVGRWVSRDPVTAAISCRYFGAIDKQTGTGIYVKYWPETVDQKTGVQSPLVPGTAEPPHTVSWERRQARYKIVDEDPNGDSVTLSLLTGGKPTTETHHIACDGLSDSRSEQTAQADRYLDDKNLGCSESNPTWMDGFSSSMAGSTAGAPVQRSQEKARSMAPHLGSTAG